MLTSEQQERFEEIFEVVHDEVERMRKRFIKDDSRYKEGGTVLPTKIEERWMLFFSLFGLKPDYEPKDFRISGYWIDLFLPKLGDNGTLIEIKPAQHKREFPYEILSPGEVAIKKLHDLACQTSYHYKYFLIAGNPGIDTSVCRDAYDYELEKPAMEFRKVSPYVCFEVEAEGERWGEGKFGKCPECGFVIYNHSSSKHGTQYCSCGHWLMASVECEYEFVKEVLPFGTWMEGE